MGPKMRTNDLGAVVEALRGGSSFLVTSHVGPDGDALGSMLAMRELLFGLGKETVELVHHDSTPLNYRWLPNVDVILRPEEVEGAFDTVIVLDCALFDRVGSVQRVFPRKAKVIVIDHHLEEEPDGDVTFVDASYAAVGEILVELFLEAGVAFTEEAAVTSYVALATDTGGFRYSNTTPRTHRLAAHLVETGLDVAELSERLFDRMTLQKFNLLARVLSTTLLTAGGKVACLAVRKSDLEEVGATNEDIDGLINFARNVDTVDVACMFKEMGPTTTKLSLRARDGFNAADFCKRFGGGGHAAAAGATFNAPLEEVQSMVLRELHSELEATA